MKNTDGGPAFPHDYSTDSRDDEGYAIKAFSHTEPGMTKLDYFAAKAMQGLLAGSGGEYRRKVLAGDAVRVAEATLAELEGRDDGKA